MKRQILLLYGGESTEHDVSVVSAGNVLAALDRSIFDVTICYIDTQGHWWLVDEIASDPQPKGELQPLLGRRAFSVDEQLIKPDVILPILHGPNGEDGSVQALAQLLHIPMVGCDMTASALAMSKRHAKQIAEAAGYKTVPFVVHHAQDSIPVYEELSKQFGGTLFVKPNGAGSSLGANKADDQQSLEKALNEAHEHDDIVLIEAGLDHPRELEVAVLGNYPDVKTSAVAEITPEGEFYSFESKYDSASTSEVTIPASISGELSDEIKEAAQTIYNALGCSGLTRVDFFLSGDTLYFNEANTLPGFTNISVYPKAWEYEGMSYSKLIEALIDLAV